MSMAREGLEGAGVLERMAEAVCAHCAGALDGGGQLLPTLMVWYEGDDLSLPGAVIVFEPAGDTRARPGEALRTARDRLAGFTREAAAWVLAYDGLVSGNGDSSAAVMLEARVREPPLAATLVRRYRPRSGRQPFAWTGIASPV